MARKAGENEGSIALAARQCSAVQCTVTKQVSQSLNDETTRYMHRLRYLEEELGGHLPLPDALQFHALSLRMRSGGLAKTCD